MSIKCPLCGFIFEPQRCPADCPLAHQCRMVCCPNCGYGTPAESTLVKLWRKLHSGRKSHGRKTHR